MQRELDFTAARARRDIGIERAARHATRIDPEWLEKAFAFVRQYAENHDRFLTEDIRAASRGVVPVTENEKAWGAVMQRAARAGVLAPAGYAPAKTSNCSPKVLWRSLAHRSAA